VYDIGYNNVSNTYSARSLVNTYKFCCSLYATVWCIYVPVRLTVNFPGRWIGRRGPTMATANFRSYCMWLFLFVGFGQRGSPPIRTKNTWWTGTTDSRYLCHCFCCLAEGKVLSPPLAGCRSMLKILGVYAKIWHWSASVWALKWSKNCCTSPFSFRIHWFNIVFF